MSKIPWIEVWEEIIIIVVLIADTHILIENPKLFFKDLQIFIGDHQNLS